MSLVTDFCRMKMCDLPNKELTTVPGIGNASAELFEEAGIGGTYNKHSVTNAVENYLTF